MDELNYAACLHPCMFGIDRLWLWRLALHTLIATSACITSLVSLTYPEAIASATGTISWTFQQFELQLILTLLRYCVSFAIAFESLVFLKRFTLDVTTAND